MNVANVSVERLVGCHPDDLPCVQAAAIIGDDGKIYSLSRPARHHDIIQYMVSLGHKTPIKGGDRQGFLMCNGEFASRRHAKGCAEHHNQILPKQGKLAELYSEDVW